MVDSALPAAELVSAICTTCYPLSNPFDDFYPDDMSAPESSGLSTLMACDSDWGWIENHPTAVAFAAAKLLESMSAAGRAGGGDWVSCEFTSAGTRFIMASRAGPSTILGAIALMETVPERRSGGQDATMKASIVRAAR